MSGTFLAIFVKVQQQHFPKELFLYFTEFFSIFIPLSNICNLLLFCHFYFPDTTTTPLCCRVIEIACEKTADQINMRIIMHNVPIFYFEA